MDFVVLGCWVDMVVDYFKDVVIVVGGFFFLGFIFIGGDLLEEVLDVMIGRVNCFICEFIVLFFVFEFVWMYFFDGGMVEGVVVSVFLGDFLLEVVMMDVCED